jgi:hypothetical protein
MELQINRVIEELPVLCTHLVTELLYIGFAQLLALRELTDPLVYFSYFSHLYFVRALFPLILCL